jgi:peptide/nickel transport system substrate-binding protein
VSFALRYRTRVHPGLKLGSTTLFLNTRQPRFNNLEARRAINYAIDRDRLIRLLHLSPDQATATCQILPEGFPGHQPYCPYTADAGDGHWHSPDMAKATRLAQESGTTHIPVTIWINGATGNDAVNAYLVGLLKKLGYQATFQSVPDDQFVATVGDSSHKIQVSLGGWIADIPRPSDFFVPVLSCHSYDQRLAGSANFAGFCDPHIDQLVNMAQAAQLTDPGAFRKLWAEIDELVTEPPGSRSSTSAEACSSPPGRGTTRTRITAVRCSTRCGSNSSSTGCDPIAA